MSLYLGTPNFLKKKKLFKVILYSLYDCTGMALLGIDDSRHGSYIFIVFDC